MNFFPRGILLRASALAVGFGAVSCSVPRRQLSNEEKRADLHWVYSMFNEYYAPMEYKEEKNDYKFDDLKAGFLDASDRTENNDAFYHLAHSFVAHFQDAHTSANFFPSDLSGRAKLAYLGFFGVRKGNGLLVEGFLPTMYQNLKAGYPVNYGDLITHVNGQPITDYVLANFVKTRDLGNTESNISAAMLSAFFRFSLNTSLPTEPFIQLTLKNFKGTKTVKVPWITKDLVKFYKDLDEAYAISQPVYEETSPAEPGEEPTEDAATRAKFAKIRFEQNKAVVHAIRGYLTHKNTEMPAELKKFIDSMKSHQLAKTFERVDLNFANPLASNFAKKLFFKPKFASVEDQLRYERFVPDNAMFIENTYNYPSYMIPVNEEGKVSRRSDFRLGYVRLASFSPYDSEDYAVAELKNTINTMQSHDVSSIVVDLLDNGGGSISLGLRLATLLAQNDLALPTIQLKVNDSWIDEFDFYSNNPYLPDPEREIMRRVFEQLKEDKAAGLKISRPLDTSLFIMNESLSNEDLTKKPNVIILVNEFCASMCDVYSAMMQDNQIATVMGTQTMGAGGNVNMHLLAPNSNMLLSQTESLIQRLDGSYIENNGIKPDIEVAAHESIDTKYRDIIEKSFEALAKTHYKKP